MDIYKLLFEIIKTDGYKTVKGDFSDKNKEKLLTQHEKEIFELIKNICSMGVKYEQDIAIFCPTMIWYEDNTRSYGPQDIKEEEYERLEELDIERLPDVLAVRITELLWTYRKKYKMAEVAIVLYKKIFIAQFDANKWTRCLEAIRRSVVIARKINKQELLEKSCNCIYEKICELNGEDSLYLSVSLIEILYEFKGKELDTLIDKIDVVISKTVNIKKLIRAYELKIKLLISKKDSDAEKNTKEELADIYVNAADKFERKNVQEVFEAEKYYREAVFIYRRIGEKNKAELTHKKVIEVQGEIQKYMIPIVGKKDVTENRRRVERLFENLSFKEHILMIAYCVQLYGKEDLKKRVIEEGVNPISSLFGMGYKDEKGRTIIDIPALDINDPTGNTELLELHMHSAAKLIEEISGNTYLKWSIELLNENHKFEKNNLKFLVENNPIIPTGRANIILSALYYGLKGDIYLALHILAPQTEKIFRTIAEDAGGIITTLEDDGSSKKKVLSTVFDMPELKECYDNDILFLLKGLLNEKAGANIRNEIAHGIMGEQNGSNGCAIYFFCLFLKILSFTSIKEYENIENITETEED